MSYSIKQYRLKGVNLPRSGLLEQLDEADWKNADVIGASP